MTKNLPNAVLAEYNILWKIRLFAVFKSYVARWIKPRVFNNFNIITKNINWKNIMTLGNGKDKIVIKYLLIKFMDPEQTP